jgi:hypothetical protein
VPSTRAATEPRSDIKPLQICRIPNRFCFKPNRFYQKPNHFLRLPNRFAPSSVAVGPPMFLRDAVVEVVAAGGENADMAVGAVDAATLKHRAKKYLAE